MCGLEIHSNEVLLSHPCPNWLLKAVTLSSCDGRHNFHGTRVSSLTERNRSECGLAVYSYANVFFGTSFR